MSNNLTVAVSGQGKRATNAELAMLHDQFVNGNVGGAPMPKVESNPHIVIKDGMRMRDTATAPENQDARPDEKVIPDFSGKDFAETQKMLNQSAKINSLNRDIRKAKEERLRVIGEAFKNNTPEGVENIRYQTPDDVIQYHLDQWKSYDELEQHLRGSLKEQRVADRINEFFTHPDTGEVLEMVGNPRVKTEINELDFKRGLILYFKRNDEYMEKIDEEIQKLNQAQEELDKGVTEALNPLKDNILAYVEYLIANAQPADDDDSEVKKRKQLEMKKAESIRSAYTLENMIKLVKDKPSMIKNALSDFRSESRIRDIGQRYTKKLMASDINYNLSPLLADDPAGSVEYKVLPQGDYPAGLENFTIFFIIRSLSMTLPDPNEATFHAAVSVAFQQLVDGKTDPDVADMMKRSIVEFLSYFA